jgi:hypothetical protein
MNWWNALSSVKELGPTKLYAQCVGKHHCDFAGSYLRLQRLLVIVFREADPPPVGLGVEDFIIFFAFPAMA